MKILHVISGLKGGGAEHFVLELCRQSQKDPENNMSVLTIGAADEMSSKFHHEHIDLISASSNRRSAKGFKAFSALRLLMKQPHGCFHGHMFHACVLVCIAKIFRPSIKIIFTLHNDHVLQLHRQLILFLLRPLRNADIIFPGMRRKWFQKKKIEIIPTGINFGRFDTSIEKPALFTCAFIGRLEEEKNPLALIDIAKSFQGENFLITVAGVGPLKNVLEQKISSEKLTGHFNLVDYCDNIPKLLKNSHCLLITSLWEGMPLVILEAAAAGVPVIAAPVGVIPSLVSNSEGYVGPLSDFPGMIRSVLENYDVALANAMRLKEKVIQQFSIERSYSMHINVYSH